MWHEIGSQMKAGNKNQGQNDNNQSVNPAARPARSEHIDMLRGAAAGFVLCDHLRSYTFTNFGSLSNPGLLTKGFYAVTSFGPRRGYLGGRSRSRLARKATDLYISSPT